MSQFGVYIFGIIMIHSKEGSNAAACQQICMPDCARNQMCIGKVWWLCRGTPATRRVSQTLMSAISLIASLAMRLR